MANDFIAYCEDGNVIRIPEDKAEDLLLAFESLHDDQDDPLGIVCILPEDKFLNMVLKVASFLKNGG